MNTSFRFRWAPITKHLRLALAAAGALLTNTFVTPARAVTEPSALTGERKSYASSWQQEIQEGADADKEITQQMGLYDNPPLQDYVQAVGERVLAASTFADPSTPPMYRNTKFTFRVLDTAVVNAFALPGGYVYVTRGLLSHVDNEAQLAVVLGHEIGHVAARHASQQARRTQWGKLGVIAGAILGQTVLGNRMPNFAQDVVNNGSQALQVFMLRYSREDENQADTLGVTYALNAGYAAEQSARFFDALRQLQQQDGQGLPTWMSTHPDPGNRADHVMQLVSAHRNAPGAERRVGQPEYLQHVEGMIVGNDPRQGFTQNGEFYHPTLHFQLPVAPNWKVDNQPNAVVFSDPSGQAQLNLKLAPANRTHDAASQFVADNKVQVTASGDTAVNGLPTTVIVGRANSNQGQVGVWDAFIELEGKVYSLQGLAALQAFEQERSTFESIAGGFGPLRDPRMAAVQPARLRIVRADRSAPFAAFVPTALPPDFNAQTVAIMNQVGLNEAVPAGAPLKVPEVAGASIATPGSPAAAPIVSYPQTPAAGYPTTAYPNQAPTPYPAPPPASSTNANGAYPAEPPYQSAPYPNAQPGYPVTSSPSYSGASAPSSGASAPVYAPAYPPGTSSGAASAPGTYPSYPPSAPAPSYPASATPYPQNSTPYPPPGTAYPPPGAPYPQNNGATPDAGGYPGPGTAYPSYAPPASTPTTSVAPPAPNWPH